MPNGVLKLFKKTLDKALKPCHNRYTPQKKETPMIEDLPSDPLDIYNLGWENAFEVVFDVISEMQASMNFHNPTLDELEQRIS